MGNLELFADASFKPQRGSAASPIEEAEKLILELADFIYGHTALKPISKTLFVVSRCLLAAGSRSDDTVDAVLASYRRRLAELGPAAPTDDYDLRTSLSECADHLPHILRVLDRVAELCAGSDSLGLVFNTLLRGKWEAGEGLGTHLTPEEVTAAMVRMAVGTLRPSDIKEVASGNGQFLFGDPCGGTGRFVYWLARELRDRGVPDAALSAATRLFDQSSLAVDFAKLNFAYEGLSPSFEQTADSLTSERVSEGRGSYLAIATNPPFGSGKYRWSEQLEHALGPEVLAALGLQGAGDTCDPAALFAIRCLDLLSPHGVLAIVLPDGVVNSHRFKHSLETYEHVRRSSLDVRAVVSLPVATFSLGGTVAKTSFVIIRKQKRKTTSPLFLAICNHVGFVKRGNRRAPDPAGNDLPLAVKGYLRGEDSGGTWTEEWRSVDRLIPSMLLHAHGRAPADGKVLGDLARLLRTREEPKERGERWFHVSVLDVDETGLVDVATASRNRPATPGLSCIPGDILISCLNPRIWRVAVVPDIEGAWTCSPEFAVFRPTGTVDSWALSVALHHKAVREEAASLASGTSSSRQRVDKRKLASIHVPHVHIAEKELGEYRRSRLSHYRTRLREDLAFRRLHQGDSEFAF